MSRFRSTHRLLAGLLPALCVAASPAHAVLGDLNGDFKLNVADVRLALQVAAGQTGPPASVVPIGDVAGGPEGAPDGRIDIVDAVRILRAATGLDPFPGPVVSAGLTGSVSLNADVQRDWRLPRAWWVRGTVSGPDAGQDPKPARAVVFVPRSDPGVPVSAPATDGSYVFPVRNGLNDAFLDLTYLKYGGDGLELDYTARIPLSPSSLDVEADATQDFTYGAVPSPVTLSGAITAPGWNIVDLNLFLGNGGHATAITTGDPPAAYTVTSAPGMGSFAVSYAYGGPDDMTDLSASLTGRVWAVGPGGATNADLTLPPLVTLTGTVTGPGDALWIETYSALGNGSNASAYRDVDEDGQYTLATPAGNVRLFLASVTDTATGERDLIYAQALTVPANGGTMPFSLPKLPTLRTLSGTVWDATGQPAGNVAVWISPDVDPWTFSGWTASAQLVTAADGTYSVQLPSGSYFVELTPPAPQGPPAGAAAARAGRRPRAWFRR